MSDPLFAALRRHNITLPEPRQGYDRSEWRYVGARGTLPAFGFEATLLVTNGVTAFALLASGEIFHCHLAAFEETKEPTTASGRVKRSTRQDLLDLI